MNRHAEMKIFDALYAIRSEAEVNGATLYKGYAEDNGLTGWQLQWFGDQNHTYLGNSVSEALDAIANWHNV